MDIRVLCSCGGPEPLASLAFKTIDAGPHGATLNYAFDSRYEADPRTVLRQQLARAGPERREIERIYRSRRIQVENEISIRYRAKPRFDGADVGRRDSK